MKILDQTTLIFCYHSPDGLFDGVFSHMGKETMFQLGSSIDFHNDASIRYHFTGFLISAIRAGELD